MTDAVFSHLPPGVELSDLRQLRLCADLPELPDNKAPPSTCPLCGSAAIAPEDSGMDFPEETVVYACMGAYTPTEQGDEEQEKPRAWEALPPCWNLYTEQALELVSSYCSRHPELVPVSRLLQGVSNKPVPVLPGPGSGVWLRLRDLTAERLPDSCPICGSDAAHLDDSFTRYECGALFSVSSQKLDAQGNYIPVKWAGELPCRKPSLLQLLTLLGRRLPPASRAADACMRALWLVHT
jgi:hypothetical protein